jgi:hypothetical protein
MQSVKFHSNQQPITSPEFRCCRQVQCSTPRLTGSTGGLGRTPHWCGAPHTSGSDLRIPTSTCLWSRFHANGLLPSTTWLSTYRCDAGASALATRPRQHCMCNANIAQLPTSHTTSLPSSCRPMRRQLRRGSSVDSSGRFKPTETFPESRADWSTTATFSTGRSCS